MLKEDKTCLFCGFIPPSLPLHTLRGTSILVREAYGVGTTKTPACSHPPFPSLLKMILSSALLSFILDTSITGRGEKPGKLQKLF